MHTSSNRLALVIAILALVVAVAGTGGPVIARAFDAANADKVDGRHAVGAGATSDQRKGKLVATNPQTGRLPASIIDGSSFGFPDTVPTGKTVRGAWGFDTDVVSDVTASTPDIGAMIHYPARIGTRLTLKFVPVGASVSGCGGSWESPTAAQGNLCVYLQESVRVDGEIDGYYCNPYGAGVFFSLEAGASTDAHAVGTWAATPGTTGVTGDDYCVF